MSKRVLVFGDSLLRGVAVEKCNATVYAWGGSRISEETVTKIIKIIRANKGPKIIILCIGTNNLGARNELMRIKAERLVEIIKKAVKDILKEKGSKILLSAILPRQDINLLEEVKKTNKLLRTWVSEEKNRRLRFVGSNRCFVYKGAVIKELYGRDKLHLNERGKAEFGKVLTRAVSQI